MSHASRVKLRCRTPSNVVALIVIGTGVIVLATERLTAQGENGSPGPLAQSCGVPSSPASAAAGGRGLPTFPLGQYPVKLPSVSMLGARNDLPNPYRPRVSWGQFDHGRKR